jgi:hypothetical protein
MIVEDINLEVNTPCQSLRLLLVVDVLNNCKPRELDLRKFLK